MVNLENKLQRLIRARMDDLGIKSLNKLHERCGVSYSTIWRLMNTKKKYAIGSESLIKILDILDIPIPDPHSYEHADKTNLEFISLPLPEKEKALRLLKASKD